MAGVGTARRGRGCQAVSMADPAFTRIALLIIRADGTREDGDGMVVVKDGRSTIGQMRDGAGRPLALHPGDAVEIPIGIE